MGVYFWRFNSNTIISSFVVQIISASTFASTFKMALNSIYLPLSFFEYILSSWYTKCSWIILYFPYPSSGMFPMSTNLCFLYWSVTFRNETLGTRCAHC
jgi:hypothetical protein